MGNLEHFMGTT